LSSQDLDFSSQEPEDHGDRFGASVVAGNSNIDVFKRRVSVAKGNAGDVSIGSFNDGLSVASGISNNQELGLFESITFRGNGYMIFTAWCFGWSRYRESIWRKRWRWHQCT